MTRLLMMEGNTKDRRAAAALLGVRSSSQIYADAVHAHFPQIDIDVINAADPDGAVPAGRRYTDYDGFIVSGSALHAYDTDFAVTNQIAVLREVAEVGLPILGSCWGLQIAAVAAGGSVGLSPHGREVGFARKIVKTEAGQAHPLLAARTAAFDAPCIHYDEVTRLPDNATLLASNQHSNVQAAIIPLGKSNIWAVQYHPEFDLAHLATLYTLYGADMIEQGFFANGAALASYCDKLTALAVDPAHGDLAWQLGIDRDVLDHSRRRSEIIAWINHAALAGQ